MAAACKQRLAKRIVRKLFIHRAISRKILPIPKDLCVQSQIVRGERLARNISNLIEGDSLKTEHIGTLEPN